MFVLYISPFYLVCCANDMLASTLRGAGESLVVMICCLSAFVAARQIYLLIVSRLTNSALIVGMGYPLGWVLCCLLLVLCYRFIPWEKKQKALQKTAV